MDSEPSDDRRRFKRVPFEATVELVQGVSVWSTSLEDISLNGVLVQRPEFWDETDDSVGIRVKLTDSSPTREIRMHAVPVHDTEGLLGFERLEIDSENLSELRRLLEHHLDHGEIQRELPQLIKGGQQ